MLRTAIAILIMFSLWTGATVEGEAQQREPRRADVTKREATKVVDGAELDASKIKMPPMPQGSWHGRRTLHKVQGQLDITFDEEVWHRGSFERVEGRTDAGAPEWRIYDYQQGANYVFEEGWKFVKLYEIPKGYTTDPTSPEQAVALMMASGRVEVDNPKVVAEEAVLGYMCDIWEVVARSKGSEPGAPGQKEIRFRFWVPREKDENMPPSLRVRQESSSGAYADMVYTWLELDPDMGVSLFLPPEGMKIINVTAGLREMQRIREEEDSRKQEENPGGSGDKQDEGGNSDG